MPQALDPAARLRNMNGFPRGVSQTFMRRERAVITAEIRAARSALTCSPGHQNEGLGVPAVSRSRRHGYATRYCSRQRVAVGAESVERLERPRSKAIGPYRPNPPPPSLYTYICAVASRQFSRDRSESQPIA